MLKEFREFAIKGNVVDLAIGVIIGVAFGAIVTSLVQDVFSPIIGILTGGMDFSALFIQLKGEPQTTLEAAQEAGATIAYGKFIMTLINFLIVAFVLFMVVKGMNRMRRRQEAAQDVASVPPPETPREQLLLTEIRDLLKARNP